MKKNLYNTSKNIVGPVLFHYVWWTLWSAKQKNIKTLYFLARDGYTLLLIAEQICKECDLDIECRYLYCSRTALRMPSYHLIGEEAFDLLLLGGYQLSFRSILDRANLTCEERQQIYLELDFDIANENNHLSYNSFSELSDKLRMNKRFRELVISKSRNTYENTINYFEQEGLFEKNIVAIVDSGWTGSMQRTLRQLLQSVNYQGKLVGFYFGMFCAPKSSDDGEYNTYYFDEKSSLLNKILFSNNLFECFLTAPHGMTIGYEKNEEGYFPITLKAPSLDMRSNILAQIKGIQDSVKVQLYDFDFDSFNRLKIMYFDQHKIRRIMAFPQKKEVDAYSHFLFCDDVAEQYHEPLAARNQLQQLKENYIVILRVLRKVLGSSKKGVYQDLYWPFGTAVYAKSRFLTFWYRINIILWETLRHLLFQYKTKN